jgi:uncharacterized membrane protein
MPPESHPDSLFVPRNLPYLVSGLYLLGFLLAFIPPLVGFIFCFALAEKTPDSWVNTHLSYHKRTFVGSAVLGIVNLIIFGSLIFTGAIRASSVNDINATLHILGGFGLFMLIGLLWMAWTIARCILSILKCNDQLPMPNPKSWLW